jgi:hypothetical protein
MPRLAAICDGLWPSRLIWLTCAASETEAVSSGACVAGACVIAAVAGAGVAASPAESVLEMDDIRELFLSLNISAGRLNFLANI